MRLPVRFSRRADGHLDELLWYITSKNSAAVAACFIEALISRCYALGDAPYSGSLKSEIGRGARILGFRNAVTIYFSVRRGHVRILKIAYRGRRIRFDNADL